MYSFAPTFEVLGKYVQMIPHIFLVVLGTVVYIVLSIIGASHFDSWLDTLVVLLSVRFLRDIFSKFKTSLMYYSK